VTTSIFKLRAHRRVPGRAYDVTAVILTVAAICSLLGCTRTGAGVDYGHQTVPVLVAKVERKNLPDELHAIGTVNPYSTVAVESQVDGKLMEVHFRQGDEVRKGQLLFTIDPKPFAAALNAAQAQLQRDRAQMLQAETDERRYAYLLAEKVGSREQSDQAHANAAALRATVAADEAAVETARLNLGYTSIYSPIDGRTGNLKLHPGNLVKANDSSTVMVVINQLKPVYVNFALPENQLPRVRDALANGRDLGVSASPPNQYTSPSQGHLVFIDNSVDSQTGTITLKGIFPNEEERLWPGEFVNVALTLGENPDALVVPSQAIQTGQAGPYVYVVDKRNAAQARNVTLGDSMGGEVIVLSGLRPGETVVTDGQLRLMPGATVRIRSSLLDGAAS
jgi:multidrug efflux system membrane fusion protein